MTVETVIKAILDWMTAQNVWAQPIANFLIVVACLKYILLDWRKR